MNSLVLFDNQINIFLAIGIVSMVLYILKMLAFFLVGGGMEIDSTFDITTETDISFNFISVETILAFFMGFGWSGFYALAKYDISFNIAILIAIGIGLVFMYLAAYLMFCVKKLEKNVKFDINELKDKTGRAYTSFAPKSKGQIEIDFNGRLSVLDAYNLTGEEIKSFTSVKVEKIEDNKIYIVKGE